MSERTPQSNLPRPVVRPKRRGREKRPPEASPEPIPDQELRRLDQLASLGDLAAEIVHEVRNPLVSMKTFLQLLPERLDDPEFRTRFLDVVGDEVERIERLLNALLAHARPASRAPQGTRTAVDAALRSVSLLLEHRAAERSLQLEFDVPDGLPGVTISEDGLRQVVLNLTMNAIEVTPGGGTVRIRAQHVARGVEVLVEDQGPGVPQALRAQVFERFYSTKDQRPGGLGLTISRRIIEESEGTIQLTDRAGGGSIFRILLPVSPA